MIDPEKSLALKAMREIGAKRKAEKNKNPKSKPKKKQDEYDLDGATKKKAKTKDARRARRSMKMTCMIDEEDKVNVS